MRKTGKAGLAQVTIGGREWLVAITPLGGRAWWQRHQAKIDPARLVFIAGLGLCVDTAELKAANETRRRRVGRAAYLRQSGNPTRLNSSMNGANMGCAANWARRAPGTFSSRRSTA
jgi:hypothetical protein